MAWRRRLADDREPEVLLNNKVTGLDRVTYKQMSVMWSDGHSITSATEVLRSAAIGVRDISEGLRSTLETLATRSSIPEMQ